MSVKAMTWVFDHSPYTLGARLVHLALADVANDDHDWLVWASQPRIAAKAKVSIPTVSAALKRMIKDGFLSVEDKNSRGQITYRFLRPTPKESEGSSPTPQEDRSRPPKLTESHNLLTEEEHKAFSDPLLGFSHFWERYPKRSGKRIGRGKCEALWSKLSLDDRRAAFRGATHYANACNQGLFIAKDPERFIRDRCWEDWQEPAVTTAAPQDRHARIPGPIESCGKCEAGFVFDDEAGSVIPCECRRSA